jgi:subtilisin family serine protease
VGCTDHVGPNSTASRPDIIAATATTGVNVLLKSAPTAAVLADLNTIGTVLDQIPQLQAVLMRASAADVAAIQAKPYVAGAAIDKEVAAPPEPPVVIGNDFLDGRSTWNLDAVNVTPSPGFTGRNPDLEGLTGKGVYVGVLDSGLLPEWRSLFPADRIDVGRARAFGGGGGERATVSSQPDKWERDVVGHGTAIASIIIGYLITGSVTGVDGPVNGVAPEATIIPVKVLNQNNSGNISTVARGIVYVADLKAGPLAEHPVVINYSIGSDEEYGLENAAIDYAISRGVIFVAAAGNQGTAGMSYPGAYAPVISVAATGWVHQWEACGGPPVYVRWAFDCDIPEPTSAGDLYLADFSSRQLAGQELDLAAPGSTVVAPLPYRGGIAYGHWLGTSFAAPHVTGTVALMAQKKPTLRQAEAESFLKATATFLPPGSRTLYDFFGASSYVSTSWGADATGAGMLDAPAAIRRTR